jgi:ribosomal protein L11 methyltransferase
MAGQFRVLVANILAEVIARLFDAEYGYPPLAEPLAPDGVMILSGILDERAHIVEAAAQRNGFAVVQRYQEGDWVALVLRRAAGG